MESNFTQLNIIGTNKPQGAIYPVASKYSYECANAHITRGSTMSPWSLDDCFSSFPGIKDIADSIGFNIKNLWEGTGATTDPSVFTAEDVYFDKLTTECSEVINSVDLGLDWLGCLWGTPEAPYSCSCPDLGPKYDAYVKHRLNVASFWKTPVQTPVARTEFIDALQYGRKVTATVAGDISLRPGEVIRVRLNNISGFPYTTANSSMNGLYYIMGVKHVFTNSGTHESSLSLSLIAPDYMFAANGGPYYPF
jgi:hypothetical protein